MSDIRNRVMGESDVVSLSPEQPAPREAASPSIGSLIRRAALRPELTAVTGTVLVFCIFALVAGGAGFLSLTATRNYLEVAAEVGIIAIPVTLLLVAGEFDLSVGAMVGAGGILFSYPVVYHGWPIVAGLALAIGGACVVGAVNGLLVTRTRLPSFIVTLAMMFILQGATVAITNSLTGTVSIPDVTASVGGDPLLPLFDGYIVGLSASIFWWLGLALLAAWLLDCSRPGNWIYATGGDLEAAKKGGIPVNRVKVLLFMATAAAAVLVGILMVFVGNGAEASAGTGKEFQAAAAAVIGGAMITGGYGSPIGTAFGALLFGMVNQGFFYTSIDDNWFAAFVGAMLLVAVMVNTYTRSASMRHRRGRS
jgi:simple sugar transport system permease protein